ncbi:unnamed protein product [Arabidopsis arenosa]|uniref:Transmembrane protein n=1 Tax=Arabidopsis arenosa TaxID=38785 RepID=A0A8S2A4C0_ARAAE|nr:unnamed protein product [Arabidopsis arenosa]
MADSDFRLRRNVDVVSDDDGGDHLSRTGIRFRVGDFPVVFFFFGGVLSAVRFLFKRFGAVGSSYGGVVFTGESFPEVEDGPRCATGFCSNCCGSFRRRRSNYGPLGG